MCHTRTADPTGFVLRLSLACALLLAGCAHRAPYPPPAPKPLAPPPAAAEFVGSRVCADCHAQEARTQAASRHAHSMTSMDVLSLGKQAPPPGRIPGTDIVLQQFGTRYGFTVWGEQDPPVVLQLALGSGKTGMTAVALYQNTLLELRKSYFPSRHQWYLTPGHESQPETSVGLLYGPVDARRCLLCHATNVPDTGPLLILPDANFYGVGCESCHGPGSAHVAAMRAGNFTHLHLDNLASWSATRIDEMCGKCHRTQHSVGTQMESATNRFQGYGLMRSRCFRESGNKLSCLNCHNPHTDASTDMRHFEIACLRCHSPSAASASHKAVAGASRIFPGKVCPVNPLRGCVGCHMPRRPAFPHAEIPTTMVDHWIRVVSSRR